MAGFVVDISKVPSDLRNFPNGNAEATVKEAKLDVAKESGNPLVRMVLTLYHPSVGEVTMNDTLPIKFPAKIKSFWMAINDLTEQQALEAPEVDLSEPGNLVGAQFIVAIGEQEGKDRQGNLTGRMYKTIVPPWYYPISRTDLLNYEGVETPI